MNWPLNAGRNDMDRDGNYEVGYKKTPLHTRYPLGKTGNTGGRPKKKARTIAQMLAEALEMPVKLTNERGTRTMTARQAIVERLMHDAMQGDPVAAAQLDALLKKSEATAPPPNAKNGAILCFVGPEDRIIQNGKVIYGPPREPEIATTDSNEAAAEPSVEPDQPHIEHRSYPDPGRAEPGQLIMVPTEEGD
jgi:Family of unknown function (DUF5681)